MASILPLDRKNCPSVLWLCNVVVPTGVVSSHRTSDRKIGFRTLYPFAKNFPRGANPGTTVTEFPANGAGNSRLSRVCKKLPRPGLAPHRAESNFSQAGALIMKRGTRHDWYEGTNPHRNAAYGVFRGPVSRRSPAFESSNARCQSLGRRQRGPGQRYPVRPVHTKPVADPRRPDAATGDANRLRP